MNKTTNWIDTLSGAVDKATRAVNEAWDGTAEARMDTWEQAKSTVNSASGVLDQGVREIMRSYQDDASRGSQDGPQDEDRERRSSPE